MRFCKIDHTMEGSQAAGQIILALRIRDNLGPRQFSDLIGIDTNVLALLESGEKMPSEPMVILIIEKFGRSEREKKAIDEFLLIEIAKRKVPARVVPLLDRSASLSFDEVIEIIRVG